MKSIHDARFTGAVFLSALIITTFATSARAATSIEEALDTVGTLVWGTTGTPVWFGQSSVSHDGVDSAQSGAVGHGAAVTLQTTVNGPGTISFWWKVSSQTNSDYLKFFINGVQQTRISGEVNWEFRTYALPAGAQILKWTYSKNASGTAGLDRGWLDQVQFGSPATGVCNYALSPSSRNHGSGSSTSTVSVATGAGCAWTVINTNPWVSVFGTNGSGNATVSYRVAANPASNSRSGNIRIAGQIFSVSQSGTSSADPTIVTQPANQSVNAGGTASFNVGVSGTPPFIYQWQFNNVALVNGGGISGATAANLVLANVQASQAGSYRVIVINSAGEAMSSPATLTVSAPNGPISLAEALDTVGTLWGTTGTPVWFGQSSVSHDGVDAAQSGAVGHSAAVTVQTTVNGPGTISFWWKVSSEANSDYLKFFISGVQQTRISGEVDWELRSLPIPAGSQVLKWTYSKNATGSAGLDKGWVDQVRFLAGTGCVYSILPTSHILNYPVATGSFAVSAQSHCAWNVVNTNDWVTILSPPNGSGNATVNYSVSSNTTLFARSGSIRVGDQLFSVSQAAGISLPEALDTDGTSLEWYYGSSVGFTENWKGQSAVTHDGVDALQSGDVVLNGYSPYEAVSYFGTYAWVPGTLTFWWKVSSGSTNGGLHFQIDNVEQAAIVNEVDWQQRTFTIPPGRHGLQWSYSDTTPGGGQGHGWVDRVQFTPAPGCAVALTSSGAPFIGTRVSTNHFDVITAGNCPWSAINTNPWITILSGGSGPGNSGSNYTVSTRLTYTVGANPTASPRSGYIRISDQTFFITQLANPNAPGNTNAPTNCTYSLSPTNRSHSAASSTGIVSVATSADCAWSVVNTNAWVTIMSGASGTGTGNVRYLVAFNGTAAPRSGKLIIADRLFTITQSGNTSGSTSAPCTFAISPTSRSHSSASSTGIVSVATSADCAWAVFNTNAWVTIVSGTNGTGNGAVIYTVTANDAASPRSGNIYIAGNTFAITQLGTPPVCAYAISPTNGTHSSQSSTGFVSVTTTADCSWNVMNTNAWISILSSVSNSGNGVVIYSVSSNATGFERAGIIRIAGRNFLVRQSAGEPLAPIIDDKTSSLTQSGIPALTVSIAAGGATLSVQGDADRTSIIECSEDLIHWTPISTNVTPCTIVDRASTNAPRRFYRVLELP